jgi:hypothetical protein
VRKVDFVRTEISVNSVIFLCWIYNFVDLTLNSVFEWGLGIQMKDI